MAVRRTRTARRARRAAVALLIGAIALGAIGFTQLRLLRRTATAGIAMLALDVSESMSRTDVEPSRLEAATDAARSFLDGLPEDLSVGLVTFSGTAEALVPPTTERALILGALAELPRGEGTVIGDAMAVALDAIESGRQEEGEVPAAVVLLSDGRDTGSAVTPQAAAARAAGLGVTVYTVVVGRDLTGERAGANIELMEDIAVTTDGSAFTATTAGGLIDVYDAIQTELSTELAVSDFGAIFIGAAGALAVAATIAILVSLRSEP